MKPDTGLGVENYSLAFCINNRPNLDDYASFVGMRALQAGELHYIVSRTSNHWRKLFNVYAKFLFELGRGDAVAPRCLSWQAYRDNALLQNQGGDGLLFSPPQLNKHQIHLVAGKTYGLSLPWASRASCADTDFYLLPAMRTVICPYLDYRQLSNHKITRLVQLVSPWLTKVYT